MTGKHTEPLFFRRSVGEVPDPPEIDPEDVSGLRAAGMCDVCGGTRVIDNPGHQDTSPCPRCGEQPPVKLGGVGNLVVVHYGDEVAPWVLSFNGPNPRPDECWEVEHEEAAFKLKSLIEGLVAEEMEKREGVGRIEHPDPVAFRVLPMSEQIGWVLHGSSHQPGQDITLEEDWLIRWAHMGRKAAEDRDRYRAHIERDLVWEQQEGECFCEKRDPSVPAHWHWHEPGSDDAGPGGDDHGFWHGHNAEVGQPDEIFTPALAEGRRMFCDRDGAELLDDGIARRRKGADGDG